MSTEIKISRDTSQGFAALLAVPVKAGVFNDIDRLAEATTALANLLISLLEAGPQASWTMREQEVFAAAEKARRRISRSLNKATGLAFKPHILQLVRVQWELFGTLRKAGTRLWTCADDRLATESQAARDGALIMSGITIEVRLAIRCFALPGRRSEVSAHCAEVNRLARGVCAVPRPQVAAVVDGRATDFVRIMVWDDGLALLVRAAEGFADLAELIEGVVAEA